MKTLAIYKESTGEKVKEALYKYKALYFLNTGKKITTDDVLENILVKNLNEEIIKFEK